MLSLIRLHHATRRSGRFAIALAAVLASAALLATVHASLAAGQHEHSAGHAADGGADVVLLCVAAGACVLGVVAAAAVVRGVLQRPLWRLAAATAPHGPVLTVPAAPDARAGPTPALLAVFRL